MVTNGRSAYVVGVDLGQKRDYSAVAVLELGEHVSGRRDPVTFELAREAYTRLVYLERVELGTPYPDVVARIAGLVADDRLRGCTLVVDATGVGAPVVDLKWTPGLRHGVKGVIAVRWKSIGGEVVVAPL